jgi:hypothetical protein
LLKINIGIELGEIEWYHRLMSTLMEMELPLESEKKVIAYSICENTI